MCATFISFVFYRCFKLVEHFVAMYSYYKVAKLYPSNFNLRVLFGSSIYVMEGMTHVIFFFFFLPHVHTCSMGGI